MHSIRAFFMRDAKACFRASAQKKTRSAEGASRLVDVKLPHRSPQVFCAAKACNLERALLFNKIQIPSEGFIEAGDGPIGNGHDNHGGGNTTSHVAEVDAEADEEG